MAARRELTIEEKIAKAQETVVQTKEKYDKGLPSWKNCWPSNVRYKAKNCSSCLQTAAGHMMKWRHF